MLLAGSLLIIRRVVAIENRRAPSRAEELAPTISGCRGRSMYWDSFEFRVEFALGAP